MQPPNQKLDGKDHGRRAADVIEEGNSRPRAHPRHHRVDDLFGRFDGGGNFRNDQSRLALLGHQPRHVIAGVVAVRGDEDLVALAETQRPEHAVHARRDVGNEDQVLGIGADDLGQPLPRPSSSSGICRTRNCTGRASIWAPVALPLEHDMRTGPERPVVEHRDRWIEAQAAAA